MLRVMSETRGRGTGSFGFWRAGCIERCKSGSGRDSGRHLNKGSKLSTSLARFRVRVPGHPPTLTSSCIRGGFLMMLIAKKPINTSEESITASNSYGLDICLKRH